MSKHNTDRLGEFDTDFVEAMEAFSSAGYGNDPVTALRDIEITWGGGSKIGHAFGTFRQTAPDAVDRRRTVGWSNG